MDGGDPPKALLESLYDEIVSNEIKIKAVGDPDKQGFYLIIVSVFLCCAFSLIFSRLGEEGGAQGEGRPLLGRA